MTFEYFIALYVANSVIRKLLCNIYNIYTDIYMYKHIYKQTYIYIYFGAHVCAFLLGIYIGVELNSHLILYVVLVPYCYYNKLPQTYWLKTTQIYSFTI
jgi:hypothetical protein